MIADYQKFFSDMEEFRIEGRFCENWQSFAVEGLYQAFKSRLIAELAVHAPDLCPLRVIGGAHRQQRLDRGLEDE